MAFGSQQAQAVYSKGETCRRSTGMPGTAASAKSAATSTAVAPVGAFIQPAGVRLMRDQAEMAAASENLHTQN